MLLGNTVVNLDLPHGFKKADKHYQLEQKLKTIDVVESIDPRRFSTSSVDVTDQQSGYTIKADYEDFRNGLNKKEFSYFRQYIIEKDNTQVANIQLNFSDIDARSVSLTSETPTSSTSSNLMRLACV